VINVRLENDEQHAGHSDISVLKMDTVTVSVQFSGVIIAVSVTVFRYY
jgi:hypothetical protein